MREILSFPQIASEKSEQVKRLIDDIAENMNGNYEKELEELSSITGKEHDVMEFAEYWGWTDLDTLAKTALTPEPPCVRDLTKAEVEEIVGIIKEGFIEGKDNIAQYYEELLHKSLSLPEVMGIIMSEADVAKAADKLLETAKKSVIAL